MILRFLVSFQGIRPAGSVDSACLLLEMAEETTFESLTSEKVHLTHVAGIYR